MAKPLDQRGASEEFDVVIVGFLPRDHTPQDGLRRVFGLDDATAQKLVQSLPATVQRGVNQVRAEYFRKALELIGAQVEVRDPRGAVVNIAPPAAPDPPGRAPTPATPATPTAPTPAPQEVAPLVLPPTAAPRPPTPIEIQTQPHAFGATIAMREPTPPTAASPTATAFAAPAYQAPVRGPAHATIREGVVTAASAALHNEARPHDHSAAATADTHAIPRAGFRFGDTNAPFMRNILGDAPDEPAFAAPQAAAGGLSFNLPLPVAAAWGELGRAPAGGPAPPAGAPIAIKEIDLGEAAALPALELDVQEPAPVAPSATPIAVLQDASAANVPASSGAAAKAPASRAFDAAAKIRAPSAREMAAAIRKQEIQGLVSGLGAERASTPKASNILREAEQQAKAARSRRALEESVSAAEGGGAAQAKPAAVKPQAAARAPQTNASERPNALAAKRAGTARARPAATAPNDTRTFWQALGAALAFPVRDAGLGWWLRISLWSLAAAGVIFATGRLGVLGALIAWFARSSLLAFCADFHRQSLWRAVEGEDELQRLPTLDGATVVRSYFGVGLHLSLFTALSQAPLVFWSYRTYLPSIGTDDNPYLMLMSPLFWVLAMGPAVYWPIALATASTSNHLAAVWNIPLGVRALSRAPLELAAIVALGALCVLGVWAPFVITGFVAELPQVFFDATLGVALGFGCSVMGAMTGHLARCRPATFH